MVTIGPGWEEPEAPGHLKDKELDGNNFDGNIRAHESYQGFLHLFTGCILRTKKSNKNYLAFNRYYEKEKSKSLMCFTLHHIQTFGWTKEKWYMALS